MMKWQPVMLVAEKRLECSCGNLAIFVCMYLPEEEEVDEKDWDYKAYCQDCFERAQEEEEDKA